MPNPSYLWDLGMLRVLPLAIWQLFSLAGLAVTDAWSKILGRASSSSLAKLE